MPRSRKIRDLDELVDHVSKLKLAGKKIVFTHGVFDVLHVGHIHHFDQAKKMGDVLVVTLTPDELLENCSRRPVFPQDLRAEAVSAIGVVDYVAINRCPSAVDTIRLFRPDVYAKSHESQSEEPDAFNDTAKETSAVQSVGGDVCFTDGIRYGSPSMQNYRFSVFPPKVERYLDAFRQHHSAYEVLEWLERASRLRPLVIGEVIIDEYLFCEGIGKSTKDPVLAVLQESVEAYGGGSLAVANHLAGLCGEVGLVTQLGAIGRREDFVRDSLRPNVKSMLLTKSDSPTICKRRVVDRYSGNKLLEIYDMKDTPTSGQDELSLHEALEKSLGEWDITIVADYGHGMLTKDAIALLCSQPGFLAVNVQSNAGNRGFNPISRYGKADYVCLAGHEVAIETRQRGGDIRDRILEIATRINCPRFTVTQGKHGSVHYDVKAGFAEAPALATRVEDRVGAGDAVLAVTSLLVKAGAPWDIVGFVGNVAGAELVAELGNRVPLDGVALRKHITSLMQ